MDGERAQLVTELVQAFRLQARQAVRFYDAVADQLGLPITDLICLGVLRERRQASAGELAAELGLSTGAVTRVINRLHRAGLVQRNADPRDGRRVIIELIPAAEASVVGFFAGPAAELAEAVEALPQDQLRLLRDFVRDRAVASRAEVERLRREGKPHATRRAPA